MRWWVYEDDPTKRVRVHESTCAYCRDGRGLHGSRLPDNRWHGPFATREEATATALSTGRADARGCGACLPDMGRLR